ncbi:phosphoesterase, partial [Streptomyces sp. NPDC059524]
MSTGTGGPGTGRSPRGRLAALDLRLFEFAAGAHWPGAERILPRLSRGPHPRARWCAGGGARAAARAPRA